MGGRKQLPLNRPGNKAKDPHGVKGGQRVPGSVRTSAPQPLLAGPGNVWFILYYEDGQASRAFKRAADTEARQMERSPRFGGSDIILAFSFSSEDELKVAWDKVNRAARERMVKVMHGVILGHGGTSVDDKGNARKLMSPTSGDGRLYMAPDMQNPGVDLARQMSRDRRSDGTFDPKEIAKLARLPWARGSVLELHACRSGLGETSAAQAFRDAQQVSVAGETGWADFSSRPDRYVQIAEKGGDVYLRAYEKGMFAPDRGWNARFAPFGTGKVMPVVIERPNASVDDR